MQRDCENMFKFAGTPSSGGMKGLGGSLSCSALSGMPHLLAQGWVRLEVAPC